MKDKKIGSVLKTETKVIAYVVICLVVIVLGISYALFFEVKGNEKNQIVKAGTLEFTYANGSQITNENNSECFIPMSEEEALKHSECEYKISITNTGTLPGNYNINLNSDAVDKPMALNKLKVILKKEGQVVADYPKDGTTTSLVSNEKIEAGNVINYSVQVYVDADNELLNADDDEKNISIKINGDAVVNDENINPVDTSLAINYIKNIPTIENGDGLYKVTHDVGEIDKGWNQEEYRYAGSNPNNYVSFNNEIWRIVGLVNVKTKRGIEQRIKIVRTNKVVGQKDFGSYYFDTDTNNWTTSTLKDMLNGIYYNSEIGDCYKNGGLNQCDFKTGEELPKGLNLESQSMVDKEVVWNLGGHIDSSLLSSVMYEKERSISLYNDDNIRQTEWSITTDNGNKFNGVALLYPSDYSYAVGGSVRNECLRKILYEYSSDTCYQNDWLYNNLTKWLLSPSSSDPNDAFLVASEGYVYVNNSYNIYEVWPTLYLNSNVKIIANLNSQQEYGSIDKPFILG